MNPGRFIKIKADDVCACWWETAPRESRESVCRIASLSDVTALLGWYELQLNERVPLMIVIKCLLEDAASRLRQAQPINQLTA